MKYNTKISITKWRDIGKHLCSHTLPLPVLSQHELVKCQLSRGPPELTNRTFVRDPPLITGKGIGYKMEGVGNLIVTPTKRDGAEKGFNHTEW